MTAEHAHKLAFGAQIQCQRTPGLPLHTHVIAAGTINETTGKPFAVACDVDLSYGRGGPITTFVNTTFGPIAAQAIL